MKMATCRHGHITERDALQRLYDLIDDLGTQKAAAQHLGISPQYLNDILDRRRSGHKVLERLGLRRVVTYEEIK